MSLFAVYSQTQGPDGNGLLLPTDPALGGSTGTASTTNATATLASGGFAPPDLQQTVVYASVQARTPATGAPTDVWSALIKGTFYRNGNTVTQVGSGISSFVEATSGFSALKARWIVDTSLTPNQITVQVTGKAATNISWQWGAPAAASLKARRHRPGVP